MTTTVHIIKFLQGVFDLLQKENAGAPLQVEQVRADEFGVRINLDDGTEFDITVIRN